MKKTRQIISRGKNYPWLIIVLAFFTKLKYREYYLFFKVLSCILDEFRLIPNNNQEIKKPRRESGGAGKNRKA
ncbi:MAG: hypothetical protein KBC43_06025 [Bacteroidales bacterium]|nr:hypothetical protein [Bacteroidales bacterium]